MPERRRRASFRTSGVGGRVVVLVVVALLAIACARTVDVASPRQPRVQVSDASPREPQIAREDIHCDPPPTPVLVLRDSDDYGALVAQLTSNVVSGFGTPTVALTSDYRAGDLEQYAAVVYVGTAAGAPLPNALLDDIARTDRPVLWAGVNVDQLFQRHRTMAQRVGWRPGPMGPDPADRVVYKGRSLQRPSAESAVTRIEIVDPSIVETLAVLAAADGERPWAVRSGPLTFVAETPYIDAAPGDRYLAWVDIAIGMLAPDAPERHRAMVRIEDIGPATDPAEIRAITDLLRAKNVPFSLAVYPFFRDPTGVTTGQPRSMALSDRPELVDALRYALDNGGTLIMHGVTHQYAALPNPYNGLSGADFEFYRAHVDEHDDVVFDGPVHEDSTEWVTHRIRLGLAELARVGLPEPTIFEVPHYAASPVDYAAISELFPARYERSMYFAGALLSEQAEQYVPYVVRDVYGACVIPETLGFVAPEPWNNRPRRLPDDIVADAERLLVVRDGVASFFFHPTLPLEYLRAIVDGISSLGYEWVSPATILSGAS
ncbi:MAG TPA: polysaccharide deacetylase family protein [Acidimicrobiales bacterium]